MTGLLLTVELNIMGLILEASCCSDGKADLEQKVIGDASALKKIEKDWIILLFTLPIFVGSLMQLNI